MVLVLYALNVLFAVPLAMAWRSALDAGLGRSMDSAILMNGLDFSVLQDFMNLHREALSAVLSQVTWAVLTYMLLNTFLSGGILTILKSPNNKFTASTFFAGCATYFGRFLRLFILFAVVLVVVGLITALLCGFLAQALTANATSEISYLWTTVGAFVLFLVPMTLIMMIADYTRVRSVVSGDQKMLRAAWQSMGFVFRHFFGTIGLELLMLLIPVALFVIYILLDLSIGMSSDGTIILMFVLQQLFMVSRAWSKVLFYGGELEFYGSLQPVVYPTDAGAPTQYVAEPSRT